MKAGGVPVLAHPSSLGRIPGDLEEFVAQLVRYGLKGIEAFYPDHTPRQIALYRRLAKKLGLVVTGGSDFHGTLIEKAQLGTIGKGICLSYKTVEELLAMKQDVRSHLCSL